MSIKVRLIIMNFLQFFVWGSWLISLGGYMGRELHFEGGQIGAIFATMGIASLLLPINGLMRNVYTDFAILQEQPASSMPLQQRVMTRCIGQCYLTS